MMNEIIHSNSEQGCMFHSHAVQTVSNELTVHQCKHESMPALTLHLRTSLERASHLNCHLLSSSTLECNTCVREGIGNKDIK